MANNKLILRRVSRTNPHRSNSSTTFGTLLASIGGVGNGVGGTESLAAEKIPNKVDELCAKDKLARDKNDWFRLLDRFETPKPVESFLEGVRTVVGEEEESVGVEGVVVVVAVVVGGLAKFEG
jgi:hypothetical protein